MSRSFGETLVDDAAADRDRAAGDVLEPGDHAQRGRLAAAGRPDEDEELAVVDVERQAEHGLHAVVVDLVDLVERDVSHESVTLQMWNAGPSAGSTPLRGVLAVQRLERDVKRSGDRLVRRARGEHEQLLVARLAQERDRVGRHVHVADAAAGERVARAAQRDEARAPARGRPCPRSLGRSTASCAARPRPRRLRARARRRRTASARRASSSAARCRRGAARRVPAIVRKRAVSWLSSRFHEWRTASHGTPARNRRIAATDGSPSRLGTPTGMPQNCSCCSGSGSSRSSHVQSGRRKPGVVHDAVPAARAEVGAEVVPVLGDQQSRRRPARAPTSRPRG